MPQYRPLLLLAPGLWRPPHLMASSNRWPWRRAHALRRGDQGRRWIWPRAVRLWGTRAPRALACPSRVLGVDGTPCGIGPWGPSRTTILAGLITFDSQDLYRSEGPSGCTIQDALGIALGEDRL
ncbi:hypothetical protein E2562_007889 [Oryza meyeriana var. granulata]|uniref:Uncharacterized protein n=1 Tax=Oryza meyeriana var. granulata TaxID=110450 RepID=A0A6G1DVT6_9ORYZ|nr:hypothetical protein E2562_007889 [Oryza meyeriana var. granulata]